jgi:hypothetical protein
MPEKEERKTQRYKKNFTPSLYCLALLLFFSCSRLVAFEDPGCDLFRDLALVEAIDKKIRDRLPFFYNESMMGGYFNMPSARMEKSGMVAIGGGSVPPYNIYGVNFQVLERIELSANYRVYKGISELNFGHEGFGDHAERIGNIKIGILMPEDGFPGLPNIVFGAEDFFGSKKFNAQYAVMTKQWIDQNFELSLGWGNGRIRGWFGGLAWTPFRQTSLCFLKNLSFLAEYDANNYKKHFHEHPYGRLVKSRINVGLSYIGWNALQLSVHSVRGKEIAGSASLRYPIGTTCGLFPKVDDPLVYRSPIDTEPLSAIRPEQDFVQELAYAFSDQGLDLFTAHLIYCENGKKELWIKVVNNRYRLECEVKDRIQHLLAAVTPSDIYAITVVIEADAFPCQSYRFRTEDLYRFRQGLIGAFELCALSPMREAKPPPCPYESTLLFQRTKRIWTFTLRPRLLTFFGSSKGKFKYNLGIVAAPEGYMFNQVYYKLQVGYAIKSSMMHLGAHDRLNPSQLPNVRTDSIRYFQTNTVSLEQAFLQKGWNLGKGCFFRLATGYFEPAYGGVGTEFLYYPVCSNWAIGLEAATVWKRRYQGLGFTTKIREAHGEDVVHKHFVGVQYFLDLYYRFRPLCLDFKVTAGQFLAKDIGVRTEVGRYFSSGLRFYLWYTVTNGRDRIGGHIYFDKGFAFMIPLDIFLKQSSRNFIGYSMSAWLRDVGAKAETGKPLYLTLSEERWQ